MSVHRVLFFDSCNNVFIALRTCMLKAILTNGTRVYSNNGCNKDFFIYASQKQMTLKKPQIF